MAPRVLRRRARYPDLLTYLAESGDTQQHLALIVGTTQAHISRIAHGTRVPRALLAERIAAVAGVPIESFHRASLARARRAQVA